MNAWDEQGDWTTDGVDIETRSLIFLQELWTQAKVLCQKENEVLAGELEVALEDSAQYETAMKTELTRRWSVSTLVEKISRDKSRMTSREDRTDVFRATSWAT